MKWYYAEGGKQIGPVEESVLDDLVRQGVVRDETLVWREGMAAWQRHSTVRGGSNPASGPASSPAPALGTIPSPSSASDTRYCSECGRAVPASQLTAFGDVSVCAQCQPAYSQRLSGTTAHYGGFWIRFLARLIDGVIIGVAFCILFIPLILMAGGFGVLMENRQLSPEGAAFSALPILGFIFAVFVGPALYEVYFLSTRAATPGKLALNLKVIRADRAPITTGLAVGRYFAHLLTSLIPFAIGYIIAGFDREKRAVHDHICGTRVVYTR